MATTEEKSYATEVPEADTQEAQAANTKSYADNITAQYDAYIQGKQNQIDYQTEYQQNQAKRNYEDAVASYQKQYRDLTASMYQDMDNQALTSYVNGQRGGMATRNVSEIQNDYQLQRQALAAQQQKLATDTAREIEDLRAQGEFDKADALLEARQQEFQQLYADAVRVDENQYTNQQYETTLDREDAAIEREQAAIQREQDASDLAYTRSIGMMFLQQGLLPPDSILNSMGLDRATAAALVEQIKLGN